MESLLLYYSIFFLTFVFGIHIIWLLYCKLRHRFWSLQPVFQYYQWWNWFRQYSIIYMPVPDKNRYVNQEKITTYNWKKLSNIHLQQYSSLVQNNFLNTESVIYNPSIEDISCYFDSHNSPCFISLYTENELSKDQSMRLVRTQKLVGGITSRPLYLSFNKRNIKHIVSYVDYLCITHDSRKRNIAPQLIQTHIYNERKENANCQIHLFRRDTILSHIVPLTLFTTNVYALEDWKQPNEFRKPGYHILEVNQHTIHQFLLYLKEAPFLCTIYPHFSHIISLLSSSHIHIYLLRENNTILGCYGFRNATTLFEGNSVWDCIFSVKSDSLENHNFMIGFRHSLKKCVETEKFPFISIDGISHNGIIMNHLDVWYRPYKSYPCAYYLYNYIVAPFEPHNVFVLH